MTHRSDGAGLLGGRAAGLLRRRESVAIRRVVEVDEIGVPCRVDHDVAAPPACESCFTRPHLYPGTFECLEPVSVPARRAFTFRARPTRSRMAVSRHPIIGTACQHLGADRFVRPGTQDLHPGRSDDRGCDPHRSRRHAARRRDSDGVAVSGDGPLDDRHISCARSRSVSCVNSTLSPGDSWRTRGPRARVPGVTIW